MTAVKKTNYEFKPTGKPTGKKVHTGLSISSTNRINVKEQDHNKRQNVPSAKKADISQTNISKEKTEIKIKKEPIAKKDTKEKKEVNSIQVKKVVMTDTATNQSKLLNQKSTPALRNYNSNTNINPSKTTSKLAIKEIEQKPYSTNTEINKSRHNLSRITINESGKLPKQQYVLHVRKLDRIQSNSKIRIIYTNNMEEKGPVKTDFNHNIIIIKNITKPSNYSNNTFNSNISRKEINESSKVQKKQVMVSPRKNEIIKSAKKPFKLNYENYASENTSNYKHMSNINNDLKANLKNRMNNAREQRSSRNSSSKKVNTNANKTITTTVTETKMKMGRNKTELNMGNGGQKEMKITTTVTNTQVNEGNRGGRFNKLQIGKTGRTITQTSTMVENRNSKNSRNSRNGSQNRTGSTNSRGGAATTNQITTTEVRSSRNRAGGNESSGTKTVTVKKTVVTSGKSGSGSRSNSRSNSITRTQKQSTVTTTKTVTKTSSKVESNQGGNEGSVVRKVRTVRMVKK